MSMKYLTVDGMMSGTGIRDTVDGGYISPEELGLSTELCKKISKWVCRYERAHIAGYRDGLEVAELDKEGVEIRRLVQSEQAERKVVYFSAADMKKI